MTWFVQSANQDEAAKPHVQMFIAVDLDLPPGHLRLWTGEGTIQIAGNDYRGIGEFGSVSASPDHTRLLAERKAYRLSGCDPSLMSESDIDGSFGRSITEYFDFLNDAGQLVATPEINWEGRMDAIKRKDGADACIEVNAENRMVYLDVPNGWRYTHEHQQLFFSGDDGLKLVPTTMTTELLWGGRKVVPGIGNTNRGSPTQRR